jgi:hypothetical protein
MIRAFRTTNDETRGGCMVKTEIQNGLYIVAVAIALSYLLGAIAVLLLKAVLTSSQVTEGS